MFVPTVVFFLLLQRFMYDFKNLHGSRQPTDIVNHATAPLKMLLTNDKQSEVDSYTTS